MEAGSLAHRRSSGFASVSGRPGTVCQLRSRSTLPKQLERGCHGQKLALLSKAFKDLCLAQDTWRQKHLLRAAVTESVDAVDVDVFPRGKHWQV